MSPSYFAGHDRKCRESHISNRASLLLRRPRVTTLLLAFLLAAEVVAPSPAPPSPPPPPVVKAAAEGFTVESADGAYRIRLTGFLHADARFFPGDDDKVALDSFLIRRARPSFEVRVAKRFDLAFVPDFGEGKAVIQDAWAETRFATAARFRMGKFKTPVGLEILQNTPTNLLVELSLVSALLPNRDEGAMLQGDVARGRAYYALGVFNGAPDGTSSDLETSDSKDVAARLFLQPFREGGPSALHGLGFGIAGSTGNQTGTVAVYKTEGQQPFFAFASGVGADGTHSRLTPQLSYENGPVRGFAEWARSRQEVTGAKGATHAAVDATAWDITVGVVLSGE
jgi:phosphate-selective porin OprO/OprP